MTEEFFISSNERFLKILSYFLTFEESSVKREAVEEVENCGVDREYAFTLLLAETLGVDADGKDRDFFNEYFLPSVKLLSVDDYYKDEYFSLAGFDGKRVGEAELKTMILPAFTPFVRDDFEYFPNGKVLPKIGFFDKDYSYPAVLKNGREWMTLLPNEINSQLRYIGEASGKVLTYGLGLGYYAMKVALRNEVSSVTVVDCDEEVINLFNSEILPRFPEFVRKKLAVIKSDAFSFAEGLKDGDFDYIYADIWHDASDGADLYKKFKEREKFCKPAKYGYWIEDTIKYYL